MIYPVNSPFRMSSPTWGNRTFFLNGKKVTDFHDGADFISDVSSEVFSILPGKVVYDKDDYVHLARWTDPHQSAGNMVIVDVEVDGVVYHVRYLHLEENEIAKGNELKEGQLIGRYADVGRSTGPHLHLDFCSFKNWKKVNPNVLYGKFGMNL